MGKLNILIHALGLTISLRMNWNRHVLMDGKEIAGLIVEV